MTEYEEVMQRLVSSYQAQKIELSLKNMEPTRVYIGQKLMRDIKVAQEVLHRAVVYREQKRAEIFGLPIYEVADDPDHIHFC